MTSLRSLPINRRLWLILLFAIAMLILQGALLLKQINTDLYTAKAEKTKHLVQNATSVLQHYQKLEAAGSLTREQAQKQAKEAVRSLRYDGQEYFWINDQTPAMVMHPIKPQLEGQNLSGFKDPSGKLLYNEVVEITNR